MRGYAVPVLAFPIVDLAELAAHAVSADATTKQEFWRSDLGLAYAPEGSTVTLPMLLAQPDATEMQVILGTITMGVDVGAWLHYRISMQAAAGQGVERVVLAFGAVQHWEQLDELMTSYQVRRCVIDSLPELHEAKRFQLRHRGKV